LINILAGNPWLLTSVVFVFGLLVGSFLNVVIYRLPIMMQRQWRRDCLEMLEQPAEDPGETFTLSRPRSRCPGCSAPISAWQNIPVLSYLLLKGKCGACGAPISPRYPVVELLTGLTSAAVAWKFGATPEMLAALGLSWSLIALTGIDMDHQLLPDSITLPLLWAGLALSLAHQQLGTGALFLPPSTALVGAMAGYLSLWSVYWLFKLTTGKEGMGYGDFKLLAALGAWLGWQMLPLIVILSALVGAVVGIAMILFFRHQASKPIPFGPYLAAAGWIALIWGEQIVSGYLRLSGMR
jgi:leader peptidase (prepilin peptidase)/N-methyltransferase